ncbi:MAG: MGMT family protein [Candidatus Thermoplasmatota archaeon]
MRTPARAGLETLRSYGASSKELGVFVRMEVSGDAVRRVELLPRGEPTRESHPHLERVLAHMRTGEGDLADVPVDLDIRGFGKRVLDALRRVPTGKTVTYGEVARKLGVPGGARAVGNACAKNPVLIVIPCHRVVPSSGGVGNYAGAGGARTKARLLASERRNVVLRMQSFPRRPATEEA